MMVQATEIKVRLFNTLGRRLEKLTPLEPPRVKLYTCGPTVYNFAHIGNLRTYIFEDYLRRMLDFDRVFGLGAADWSPETLTEEIRQKIVLREKARASGDFALADQLRDQLMEAGVGVRDTPQGTEWYHVFPAITNQA